MRLGLPGYGGAELFIPVPRRWIGLSETYNQTHKVELCELQRCEPGFQFKFGTQLRGYEWTKSQDSLRLVHPHKARLPRIFARVLSQQVIDEGRQQARMTLHVYQPLVCVRV